MNQRSDNIYIIDIEEYDENDKFFSFIYDQGWL